MATARSLQQRTHRECHSLGMSRRLGAQPWFVNCLGGGEDAQGAASHALMAADAADDMDRSARVLASRGTSPKHKPDVGQ